MVVRSRSLRKRAANFGTDSQPSVSSFCSPLSTFPSVTIPPPSFPLNPARKSQRVQCTLPDFWASRRKTQSWHFGANKKHLAIKIYLLLVALFFFKICHYEHYTGEDPYTSAVFVHLSVLLSPVFCSICLYNLMDCRRGSSNGVRPHAAMAPATQHHVISHNGHAPRMIWTFISYLLHEASALRGIHCARVCCAGNLDMFPSETLFT